MIWEKGRISNGLKAKRSRITGRVYVMIWKSGEQGHKKDFYYQCGYGWELTFTRDSSKHTNRPPRKFNHSSYYQI